MKRLITWILMALLTAIALSPLLLASDCRLRDRTTYATYTKRTLYYYHSGHYYEYRGGDYGQLYYYEGGYYRPWHKERESIVLVPKAIEVEVHRDHYYSIDPYAQQNLLADAIVGRILRMQSEGKLGVPAGPGVTPRTKPSDIGPSGPDAAAPTGELKAGAYQNADLLKVVNESCVKCHGSTSRYTKLVTADGKLADLPSGKVWECFGLVNSGEMPKGGKSLENDAVKLFYDWAKNARK
jgi:hypothetical protein